MLGGRGNLFGGEDLPDEAQNRTNEALRAIEQADVDDLLSRDVEVLVDEFVAPFEPVTVRWAEVTMTEPERVHVPSATDVIGRQVNRTGAKSVVKVPVDGDATLLTYRSHNGAPAFTSIEGRAKPGFVEFDWIGELDTPSDAIQQWLNQRRSQVEQFLANNNRDTEGLNRQMRDRIRTAIEHRRDEELKRRNLAATLPFPVERRPGVSVPVRVHRTTVRLAERPKAPRFTPEPQLDQATYEDILRDCTAMATVFERMPLATGTREEHLRNVILGMLNTNYTGRVAGELFNGVGKKDILIRYEDRNVFIGECKFYKGPRSVTDALDQLLGYLVWRDSKAALLLFVRKGNFTAAVETAVTEVSNHAQCQRTLSAVDPARRSNYVFVRADDADRPIHLALIPFQLQP